MSESSEFREALAVAGVKYLVFIRREGNDASIDAVFQRARNVVSQNNPEGWGAFLVNEPASLDDDLLQLVVGGDELHRRSHSQPRRRHLPHRERAFPPQSGG
jgi:hypothetical protein